ncbi:MAG TPA: hypothetical protein VGM59_03480 [Dongiaceae bacterium]
MLDAGRFIAAFGFADIFRLGAARLAADAPLETEPLKAEPLKAEPLKAVPLEAAGRLAVFAFTRDFAFAAIFLPRAVFVFFRAVFALVFDLGFDDIELSCHGDQVDATERRCHSSARLTSAKEN